MSAIQGYIRHVPTYRPTPCGSIHTPSYLSSISEMLHRSSSTRNLISGTYQGPSYTRDGGSSLRRSNSSRDLTYYSRTSRDAIPALPQTRPQIPNFSAMIPDDQPPAAREPVDQAKLEEKVKKFQQEEMERRERLEKDMQDRQHQQQQFLSSINDDDKNTTVNDDVTVINDVIEPSNKFKDKRKKNLIFDEERFEETFLRCVICRESYDFDEKMPKMLPCHHTFCTDCLCQMWRVEGEFRQTLTSAFRGMPMAVKIQCPTCRDGLITSEAEVRRLPNDHTVMELLTFMKDQRRTDVQYCPRHQMQPLNFFCEPCISPVCCDCTVIDHKESKGHIVVNVNDAMGKYTPILEHTMEEIRKEKTFIDEKKDDLITAADRLDTTQEDVNNKIKDSFDKLRETIDERERELYEMTEREVGRKREKLEDNLKIVLSRDKLLTSQLKTLETAKAEKDIGSMFTGHKGAKIVLAQKIEVNVECTDSFAVQYSCDERLERKIRQEVANLADIVFHD